MVRAHKVFEVRKNIFCFISQKTGVLSHRSSDQTFYRIDHGNRLSRRPKNFALLGAIKSFIATDLGLSFFYQSQNKNGFKSCGGSGEMIVPLLKCKIPCGTRRAIYSPTLFTQLANNHTTMSQHHGISLFGGNIRPTNYSKTQYLEMMTILIKFL